MIGKDNNHFVNNQQVEYHHQISTNTKTNLKAVKFNNFIPSQQLLDLVSTYLPNLNTIACLPTDFWDSDGFWASRSNIDLTDFKNLDNFYCMVESFYHPFKHYFMHLQYTDGDESYHYQNTECRESLDLMYSGFVGLCVYKEELARTVKIEYKKDVKVIIGSYDGDVLAEIDNGHRLEQVRADSHHTYNILRSCFAVFQETK
ncbi:hypothetical protein INT47_002200 [Mucor saturninus]|uniref:Uncharacterized protein n=1 Tax=Mucor saturninus TaxID=64648 RepID=A0A8H7R627_9FUNG|nr:hypothetical protein INT47_002200 [Mucor saturninus]